MSQVVEEVERTALFTRFDREARRAVTAGELKVGAALWPRLGADDGVGEIVEELQRAAPFTGFDGEARAPSLPAR